MKRVIKTIPVKQGKLYVSADGSRYLLADCTATIEIVEEVAELPVLGKGKVITRRAATILITFEHNPRFTADPLTLNGFGFQGEMLRRDGIYEQIDFDHCLLVSDLDLTEAGECTFEIQCSQEQLRRLRAL